MVRIMIFLLCCLFWSVVFSFYDDDHHDYHVDDGDEVCKIVDEDFDEDVVDDGDDNDMMDMFFCNDNYTIKSHE